MYPTLQDCPLGHPQTPTNTFWHRVKGRKPVARCKKCWSDDTKRYRLARLEAKASRPRPEACEACGNPDQRGYAISFDHNHDTDLFRGWLCHGCNAALGWAGDNAAVLRALADYLDQRGSAPRRHLRT